MFLSVIRLVDIYYWACNLWYLPSSKLCSLRDSSDKNSSTTDEVYAFFEGLVDCWLLAIMKFSKSYNQFRSFVGTLINDGTHVFPKIVMNEYL